MYEATKTMRIDGPDGMPRLIQAGDRIQADAILPGCLESCLRLGAIVEVPDEADAKPKPEKKADAKPKAEKKD